MPETPIPLLPMRAIELMRTALYDPAAERHYDAMSGGLRWTDEKLSDVALICMSEANWSFRYLLAYRASLTRGKPDERMRHVWGHLLIECPSWPGFRSERFAPQLKAVLEGSWRRFAASMERADRDYRENESK